MAQEAIELHLQGLAEEGQPLPRPRSIDDCQNLREYKGGIWAIVTVLPPKRRGKVKRVNITMPRRLIDAVDAFARAENETRSGLLVKAAAAYISRSGERDKPVGPRN
jgi:hypothetical protein